MNGFGRLIKSQFYSLWREKKLLLTVLIIITVVGYLMSLAGSGQVVMSDMNSYGYDINASSMFGMTADLYADFGLLFVFIAVGYFASDDMNDKTLNYEILNGHERKYVYLSRVIVSLVLGVGGGLVMFVAIPLVTTLQYGWGISISFSDAALRIALMLLFYLRVSAELVLLASLVRRTYLVYIAGTMTFIIEGITLGSSEGSQYLLIPTVSTAVMKFDIFRLNHSDKNTEIFFSSSMTAGTAVAVAVGYIIVSALCVYIGCRLFCRSDIE